MAPSIYILIVLSLFMIGIYIYYKLNPGDWASGSKPDPNAEIVDVSSTFKKRNSLKRYYETEVVFSDGYTYISKKTRSDSYDPPFKTPWTIGTKYYIDDSIQKEIIRDAINAHAKAVEKELQNKGENDKIQADAEKGEDLFVSKYEETNKLKETDAEKKLFCEICGRGVDALISAIVVDEMGKRHRRVCEDCFKQYNCKEDNTTSKEPKNARRIINAKDTDNLFCRKCGAKLLPDSVFCSKCGTKIK